MGIERTARHCNLEQVKYIEDTKHEWLAVLEVSINTRTSGVARYVFPHTRSYVVQNGDDRVEKNGPSILNGNYAILSINSKPTPGMPTHCLSTVSRERCRCVALGDRLLDSEGRPRPVQNHRDEMEPSLDYGGRHAASHISRKRGATLARTSIQGPTDVATRGEQLMEWCVSLWWAE